MKKRLYRMFLFVFFSFGLTNLTIAGSNAKAPGGHLNILQVLVQNGFDTIVILGEDFDHGGPLQISLGHPGSGFGDITSDCPFPDFNSVPQRITCDFSSSSLPPAGDYLLTVSTGNGQSQSDEYDLTIGAVGPEGIEGPEGPQGEQGIQGEKGDKGDTGDQGIQGDKGDQGIQGIQGIQGEKGDKGDKGDQGIQGIQGEKGDKGDKGDQGIQGIQGEKGDKGDTGDQGIQGDKGDKGDQGIQGIQGEKGDKGDTGVAGPAGVIDLSKIKYAVSSSISTVCPPGTRVIGGGVSCFGGVIVNSSPFTFGPTGWNGNCSAGGTIRTHAICLSP